MRHYLPSVLSVVVAVCLISVSPVMLAETTASDNTPSVDTTDTLDSPNTQASSDDQSVSDDINSANHSAASDDSSLSDNAATDDDLSQPDTAITTDASSDQGNASGDITVTHPKKDTKTRVVIGFMGETAFWTSSTIQQYIGSVRDTNVKWKSFDSACDLLQALQANTVDIAYLDVPSLEMIQRYQLPYHVVATANKTGTDGSVTQTYTAFLVSKKSSSINRLSNVKSHTVGIVPFSLSGDVIPLVTLQVAGLLPDKSFKTKDFSSEASNAAALKEGTVDVIGYASNLPLNIKQYSQLASVPDVPNGALVVAKEKKDDAAIQDIVSLLESVPKKTAPNGVGKMTGFGKAQESRYQYWLSQMVHSGLFNEDVCSLGKHLDKDSSSNASDSSDATSDASDDSSSNASDSSDATSDASDDSSSNASDSSDATSDASDDTASSASDSSEAASDATSDASDDSTSSASDSSEATSDASDDTASSASDSSEATSDASDDSSSSVSDSSDATSDASDDSSSTSSVNDHSDAMDDAASTSNAESDATTPASSDSDQ